MPAIIEPETARLYLRQWRDSDYAPFARINADPGVMKYFPTCLDRQASDAMADRIRVLIASRGWGVWAVELKQTQTLIGFVGLHIPTDDLPFKPCVEIAWRLAADCWGRGYATEAAKAALQVGFDGGLVVAAEAALVEALKGEFACPAARGFGGRGRCRAFDLVGRFRVHAEGSPSARSRLAISTAA